jgi:hypothetical protein
MRPSGCVTAVSVRVSKALAALALQWAFQGHVRFHQYSQTVEFCERLYPRQLRFLCHWYNEVIVGRRSLVRPLAHESGDGVISL